jgi:hypothetical protein
MKEKVDGIVQEQACQSFTAHCLSCNLHKACFGCELYSCLQAAVGSHYIEIFGITLFGIFVTMREPIKIAPSFRLYT